jgi:hypothetical protein
MSALFKRTLLKLCEYGLNVLANSVKQTENRTAMKRDRLNSITTLIKAFDSHGALLFRN